MRAARGIAGLLGLSILWLLSSITIIGAPAATAALLTTVRAIQDGEEPDLVRTFWAAMRGRGWALTRWGWAWTGIGIVLALDLLLLPQLGDAAGPLTIVLVPLVLLYAMVTVHLVSTALWGSVATFGELVRFSFGAAVSAPGATLQGLCGLGLAVVAAVLVPLSLVVTPALLAHVVVMGARKPHARFIALAQK